MVRLLYRCLVALHPVEFRARFGGEMLWIFDESGGAAGLFADAAASVARQWLLRTGGPWKMATGCAIASLLFGGVLATASLPARHLVAPSGIEDDFPVDTTSSLPPDQFSGHWAGYFHWPGPAGQMEVTLTDRGDSWTGEFLVRGPDGVLHRGAAENIQFAGDSVFFHVQTAYGRMRFHGRLKQGRLSGALKPADAASF
jgi:hypothetical protein